jgi:RNA polymerase sigma factor (sigma-70 family)
MLLSGGIIKSTPCLSSIIIKDKTMSPSSESKRESNRANASDLELRCEAIVAALNEEEGWTLSAGELQAYRCDIPCYLPDPCSESQIHMVATNYHRDHALVQTLLEPDHQQHTAAWTEWMPQVIRILQHAGLARSDDTAENSEDLTQVALMALVRALPHFRYASRFSTWAYQVIVQSVQRHLRDQRAAKRAVRADSLEQSGGYHVPIGEAEHPVLVAEAHVLAELIERLLAAQPDQRLVRIFRLWAYADARVEEIGQQVQLSPARVRILLNQIRDLLQHNPDIQAWLDSENRETEG